MPRSRPLVFLGTLLFFVAACTSSSSIASNDTPEASASAVASPTPSPSPSPTPTGPLTITAAPVHNGEVTQAFAPITLAAQGGVQPYSWAVGTGALPPGLALSAAGVISGQVTKDGTFKFTVAVADSGGSQASKSVSITVFKALKVTARCAQTCVIGRGCAKCGSFGTVTGGETPYAYKVTGGGIPSGMKLSALSLVGGFPAGSFGLTVQVTDKFGATASVAGKWSIYNPATFVAGTNCVNSGNPPLCSTTGWSYSGGNPGVLPQVAILGYGTYCDPLNGQCFTESKPPPGWVVSVKAGTVTFSAGGIVCNAIPSRYASYITVVLTDPSACATTATSNKATLLVDISNNC